LARGLEAAARAATRDLAGFALPQRCPSCAAVTAGGRLLCEACEAGIPRLSFAVCAWCLARERHPVGCLAHPRHAVRAAWVYDERAALVVHALKYGGRPALAARLGAELARVAGEGARPELVLPVPLHRARERERGYDQAGRLAEALGRVLGVPRLEGALTRARATAPQARRSGAARRANVRGAFRVREPAALAGRRVLVVDDVITTGATFEACFEALIACGAHPAGVALAWAQ
jgi:ComF family protein